jgi:hypothetical protein
LCLCVCTSPGLLLLLWLSLINPSFLNNKLSTTCAQKEGDAVVALSVLATSAALSVLAAFRALYACMLYDPLSLLLYVL